MMANAENQTAEPVKTDTNPAGNWPYPYDNTDEE